MSTIFTGTFSIVTKTQQHSKTPFRKLSVSSPEGGNSLFPKNLLCVCDNGESCNKYRTEKVVINTVDKTEAKTWQHFSFNLVQVNNYYIVGR